MSRRLIITLLVAAAACTLSAGAAENALWQAQSVLKAQGYFFGEVNGQPSEETTQSLRRFQIRNLLPVTGELDAATTRVLEALGAVHRPPPAGAAATRPGLVTEAPLPKAPTAVAPSPAAPVSPSAQVGAEALPPGSFAPAPAPLAPTPSAPAVASVPAPATTPAPPPVTQSQPPPPYPTPTPDAFPSAPSADPGPPLPDGIHRLPPLAQAQEILQREGFYNGNVDGRHGSRTRVALLDYQAAHDLPPTGRLDAPTRAALGIEAQAVEDPPRRHRRPARGLRIFGLRFGWR